jgi:hypothetical protein
MNISIFFRLKGSFLIFGLGLAFLFLTSSCTRTTYVTQQGANYNQSKVMKYDKVTNKTKKPKTQGTRQKQY